MKTPEEPAILHIIRKTSHRGAENAEGKGKRGSRGERRGAEEGALLPKCPSSTFFFLKNKLKR